MEECRRVTESSYRGETYYAGDGRPGNDKIDNFRMAFYKEVLYRDIKTAGFIMNYPHGTVIGQGQTNSFFRGENQIFVKSQPTLYRSLEKFNSDEEKNLYRFISQMRIAEFGIFLCRLGIVQFWSQYYGDVLFEPLAQHYGLETEWLDITSDFNVALFFATCGWDATQKRWYPLTKEQTEIKPETQYGVIFHIPEWQASSTRMNMTLEWEEKEKYLLNVILPIGYQPFMRCHSQHAYGIHMETPFPLQDDFTFEKLHFRHSERLSREVFELMDGGKKIYPQEGLNDFEDIIDQIRNTTEFSEEAFTYAMETTNFFSTAAEAEKALSDLLIWDSPIKISKNINPIHVSRQRIRALNRKYEGFSIEKAYGIKLKSRKVCHGKALSEHASDSVDLTGGNEDV
jgi:hypothetical protein